MNFPSPRCAWVLAAACLVSASSASAQTKIRLATLLPRGTSQYQALEKMGQDWRSATGGAITLTIYGDGTMGTEAESVQRLRIGQLQAVTLSAAALSEIDPFLAAIEKVPMLFRTFDEA